MSGCLVSEFLVKKLEVRWLNFQGIRLSSH